MAEQPCVIKFASGTEDPCQKQTGSMSAAVCLQGNVRVGSPRTIDNTGLGGTFGLVEAKASEGLCIPSVGGSSVEETSKACMAIAEQEAVRPQPCIKQPLRSNFQRPRLVIEKRKFSINAAMWMSNYKGIGAARRGSRSGVVHASRLADNKHVALKTMRSRDVEMLQAAQVEFHTLGRLKHAHIVRALDFHVNAAGQAVLVMEYFGGTDLRRLVRHHPHQFVETSSRRYAMQLFTAVCYLHSKDVMHRHIKPTNVLVSPESMTLMLAGFNSVCDLVSEHHGFSPAGTELHMAPETIHGYPATLATDVWSAGLCVFFMLSRRLPQGRDCKNLSAIALEDAVDSPITFDGMRWDRISSCCKGFLTRCMAIEVSARPTAAAAVEEPWFGDCADNLQAGETGRAGRLLVS